MTIRILPHHHRDNFPGVLQPAAVDSDWLWKGREHLFFDNGKGAIHYLARKLDLKREDEVCIFTSSGSNYVSTCVSGVLFNYCKLSRVLTEKTRLLYVIHEFGIPCPTIEDIVAIGRERTIPVVEDCAHAVDSLHHGKRVGTFGDYALYSLPKVFPVAKGGILVGPDLQRDGSCPREVEEQVQAGYFESLPYLPALGEKRKSHFNTISRAFPHREQALSFLPEWTPYFLLFKTPRYLELYRAAEGLDIEWGVVHVKDWFCVPTQPLMREEELSYLIAALGRLL